MTKRQEFIDKYGDVLVTFSSYYKFSFSFTADLPTGEKLRVSIGGTSDDIYRTDVSANTPVRVADLEPYSGSVYRGDELVEEFYEF